MEIESNARRQAMFRAVNEHVAAIIDRLGHEADVDVFCECGEAGCKRELRIPRAVYETVRALPTRFVVDLEHVASHVEHVVERHDRFVVVENVGDAAEIARATDPRTRRGDGAHS